MITLIDGLTGSGKTWFTTRLARQEWKRKADVNINYPVKFGKDNEGIFRYHNLDELYHLKNGVIVIDDAVKLLDARRWFNLPVSFAEKIAGHRHDHIDIITNIQDFSDIDLRVRQNVHTRFRCRSIFRFPNIDRIKPIFQMISIQKKIRKLTNETDAVKWQNVGFPKIYFLSRLWTRAYYNTYDNIYLDRYICSIKYELKKGMKKGEWSGKIYSRDLVNMGKARI